MEIRLALHENPAARKFTARADDWQLVFEIFCDNNVQALSIEKHIKSMKSKVYIENLIRYPEMAESLKEKYSPVQESGNNCPLKG
jgi:putative endonuclease